MKLSKIDYNEDLGLTVIIFQIFPFVVPTCTRIQLMC